MTELLDRAEDPARMIRMIILEMEETLVEVRATAARSIADIKEMRRAVGRLDELQADWTAKAELALCKDREDLAKAALVERQKAAEMADGLRAEMAQIEQVLRGYEADIAKLQGKLREARARQNAIAARFESAVTRARAREIMHGSRTRGCVREVRAARAPRRLRRRPRRRARASASLEDEIDQLKAARRIDAELEAMKAALKARDELRKGRWNGPQDLSLFARPQGREGRRRLLDDRRRCRDRPDLHPHRLRRRCDLHQLQADA